jgi:hypothetical protein
MRVGRKWEIEGEIDSSIAFKVHLSHKDMIPAS